MRVCRRLLSRYQKPVILALRFSLSDLEKAARPHWDHNRGERRDWSWGMLPLPPPSAVLTPGLISRCPDKFKLLEPFIKSAPGAAHTLQLPRTH